jgi:hypothetical protein
MQSVSLTYCVYPVISLDPTGGTYMCAFVGTRDLEIDNVTADVVPVVSYVFIKLTRPSMHSRPARRGGSSSVAAPYRNCCVSSC